MKGRLRTAVALVLSTSLLAVNVLAADVTFKDVPKSHWAYNAVVRAAGEGLVTGIGDGKYGVEMKLSNAHIAVMICNLFYKDAVSTGQSSDWWRPYMDTAYAKGVLLNTTVGEQRANAKDWTAAMANKEINRYDLAQIILNLSKNMGWEMPTVVEMASASTKIADWKNIPTKYQTAVATAYAKGYLSGMDEKGTFMGTYSVNRAQGAVVMCALLDAKNKVDAPVYTNTTKLVNGKSATEKNVASAIDALRVDYPQGTSWDMSRSYTSTQLGSGTGGQAFAYTLSDKVFGNMEASKQSKASQLKAGDVIYLHSDDQYVVVTEVDGDEFSYASCTSGGMITWRGSGDIDDLNSKDTIYTRYDAGSGSSSSDELANGKSVTEKNVYNALMDIKSGEYGQGDTWDMEERYRSDAFGSVYGSEAFAAYLSDEVFGDDAEMEKHTDHEELKVGDVVYHSEYEEYLVVLEIEGADVTYAGVSTKGKITWKGVFDVDDLGRKDTVYTRYPDGSGSGSGSSKELANGKSVTEKNVIKALSDVEDDYSDGDKWTEDDKHRSKILGTGYGGEGFAYLVSDEVFGDLKVSEHHSPSKLKAGDIIHLYHEDVYLVVVEIKKDEITYAGVSSKDKIFWDGTMDVDDLVKKDTIYTRYPSTSSDDDTLANGEDATEKNVAKVLKTIKSKEYGQGDSWDLKDRYKSGVLGSGTGTEAFAYYVSDEIFGDLAVEEHTRSSKLKVGDIVYLDQYGEYVVVVEIDGDDMIYVSVNSKGKVFWDGMYDIDDLGKKDTIYTRYPD